MISISLKVNGHTATVTAENVDTLDEVIAKVVAAMQKLPIYYTPSKETFGRDWRPFNPNVVPTPNEGYPWGPGVVYYGGTQQL